MRYKMKQPPEVDAVQVTWADWETVWRFIHANEFVPISLESGRNKALILKIEAGSRALIARESDWVVRHADGALAVYDEHTFDATFEKVLTFTYAPRRAPGE